MQGQTTVRLTPSAAIVIAAAMLCATLFALNVRVTYPLSGMTSDVVNRLLVTGCSAQTLPSYSNEPPAWIALSCPLWVRP